MPLDKDTLAKLRIEPAERTAGSVRLPPRLGWALAAIIVVAVSIWWGLGRGNPSPVVTVAVAESVSAGDASAAAVLNATGYVVARRLATISSKVTGKILDVLIEEGMEVDEGQVLARLDDSTARRQLELAVSQREVARRSLQEVQVRLDEARRSLRRNEDLHADSLVSEAALDAAAAEVEALEARLVSLKAELEVAQRSVGLREQELEDLVIRAPFAGVVISKNAQQGEMISPVSAGGGFTRTGIATIVDMESREIEVDVNEAYINRVRPDQQVEARLDAYPDWPIPARVISIVPTADRQRATVRVRLAFEDLDPRVLPDMGVKVRFLDDAPPARQAEASAVARVPQSAIVDEAGRSYVFVATEGRVEKRAVSLGAAGNGRQDIAAGLRPGERVVTSRVSELTDGQAVQTEETP